MQKTKELYISRLQQKISIEFSTTEKKDAKIGEFWWYYEGMNIGNEISKDGSGRRPCLILENKLSNGLLLVAPITTKFHSYLEQQYIPLLSYNRFGLKECWLIANQIKLIDKKRLYTKQSQERIHRNFIDMVLIKYAGYALQNFFLQKKKI